MLINFAQLGIAFAILISFFVSLIVPFFGIAKKRLAKTMELIIFVQFSLVGFAFFSLEYSYLISDFSVENVFKNSHQAIPIIYKISGLWSNHEGSMLLWAFLLCLCNFIFTNHKIENSYKLWIYLIQIIITGLILSYIIIKSNPFVRLPRTEDQGIGFNPLLQDIGLAIHPPILYLGYVSTSIPFAIICASLIMKKITPNLMKIMQAWNLFSWGFLTLGISLGSWWAYRELGWGGYWFWDPVENASLLPWISSIALIHSLYSTKKLGNNYASTFMFGISNFLLAILTSFFVRSGSISSIHSFAFDSGRGLYILAILFILAFFSLLLFATNLKYFSPTEENSWVSRLGGINASNILWVLVLIIILFSLIYPLIIEKVSGDQVSIEGSFFKNNLTPLTSLILIILAATLPATWKNILKMQARHFIYSLLISIALSLWYYTSNKDYIKYSEIFIFFSGILVFIRMIFWIFTRDVISKKFFFIWLIHIIAGLFAMLVVVIEVNSKEITKVIDENEQIEFSVFKLTFTKKDNIARDNFMIGRVVLNVFENNYEIGNLTPEIRYYPIENTQTSESSIIHGFFYDLYAVINNISPEGKISIKLFYKPYMSFLWLISIIAFVCSMSLLYLNFKKKN